MSKASATFQPLTLSVLTVSDTRTDKNDTSGDYLVDSITAAGHHLFQRDIVKDDIYAIRATISAWIADKAVDAVLITGGTGFSGRDSTPEAISPLFDKEIDGFGELFRQISYQTLGSTTIQSRCIAGLANNTLIFCLPSSLNACKTAWEGIIATQLDENAQDCNFLRQLSVS